MNTLSMLYPIVLLIMILIAPILLPMGEYSDHFRKKSYSYIIMFLDHYVFGWSFMIPIVGTLGLAILVIPVLMLSSLLAFFVVEDFDIFHYIGFYYWFCAAYTVLRVKHLHTN